MEKYLIELTLLSNCAHLINNENTKTLIGIGFCSIEEVYSKLTPEILENIRTHIFLEFEHIRIEKVYSMELVNEELEKFSKDNLELMDLKSSFSNVFHGVILKDRSGEMMLNFNPKLKIWNIPERLFYLEIFADTASQIKYMPLTQEIHFGISANMCVLEHNRTASYVIDQKAPTISNILEVIELKENDHLIPIFYDLPMTKMLKIITEIVAIVNIYFSDDMFYVALEEDVNGLMTAKLTINEYDINFSNVQLLKYLFPLT